MCKLNNKKKIKFDYFLTTPHILNNRQCELVRELNLLFRSTISFTQHELAKQFLMEAVQ